MRRVLQDVSVGLKTPLRMLSPFYRGDLHCTLERTLIRLTRALSH